MAGPGVTLFRVRGIRIAVDFSWFIVLFLIIFWLSASYRDELNLPQGDSEPYFLAVASALLFFGSILLHELGHAFVARTKGIRFPPSRSGCSVAWPASRRTPISPSTEFKIAIAGPVVSAGDRCRLRTQYFLLMEGAHKLCGFVFVARNNADHLWSLAAVVAWLGSINLLVPIFNLVPAFPLDGGRVARAIAWWRTGSRNSGTRFAATLGDWFGLFLILAGRRLLPGLPGRRHRGHLARLRRLHPQGSRPSGDRPDRAHQPDRGDLRRRRHGPGPGRDSGRASIERALDEYFLRYRSPWFPVVDTAQHVIGLVDRPTADNVPAVERTSASVRDVVARTAARSPSRRMRCSSPGSATRLCGGSAR